ncbi:MAG: anion permease [Armatimonadota bacterium]|nr:anion permease [Armatimonadota bacterium]MDR7544690.1 anion permease [Armatimonadota bacterium]
MLALLPGLYLGWGIGANDAANTFGPQVGANIISYRRAVALAALFALTGAIVEGEKVFPTLGRLTALSVEMSVVAALAAAVSVHVMTGLGMPVSTSHAIFGALVAVGVAGGRAISLSPAVRIVVSMLTAPVGAGVIAYVLYRLLSTLSAGRLGSLIAFQRTVRAGAIVVGCYGAYALGSNNVGNAMAPFVAVGVVEPSLGALLGGLAIAAGVLTYSLPVMLTVGRQITALDPISALVAALGTALTVHLFTQLGVPVSTSQAIVGAVVGVGLTKGTVAVNRRIFWMIPASWVVSIVAAGIMAAVLLTAYSAIR